MNMAGISVKGSLCSSIWRPVFQTSSPWLRKETGIGRWEEEKKSPGLRRAVFPLAFFLIVSREKYLKKNFLKFCI